MIGTNNLKIRPAGSFAPLEKTELKAESAFFENRERALKYLDILDCDRMLYNFRKTFGREPKGEPLGGWEEPSGLLRGHSTGHFLSALAMAYSSTGKKLYKEKMDYIVSELSSLQSMCKGNPADFKTKATPEASGEENWSKDPSCWGEGFLSAYSPDQFALLEKMTKYNKIWAPYYTLHKILAGLLDCYTRGGNAQALKTAKGIGNWVYARLSAVEPKRRKEMWGLYIAGEFGGIAESLSLLYSVTGEEKYLTAAKMFDNENIFEPLMKGEDGIENRHANQHIPQITGAIEEYMATGDKRYMKIAENFFEIVVSRHMYSIGGVGRAESFRDGGKLAANIKEDTNCETCAAYNLMKIARLLYAFNPKKARYMDYYERAMINQILASQSPEVTDTRHNGVTYMLPIGPGAEKEYSDDYRSFTCCHGTGMENHVKYQDASFFEAEEGLYVNQYLPSVFRSDVTVDIESNFPGPEGKITVSGDADKTLYFRVPVWSENPFGLPTEGRYAVMRHRSGQTETLNFKFTYSVRTEYTPDSIEGGPLASVLYGPFVMVTEDSSKEYLTFGNSFEENSDAVTLKNGGHEFIPMYKMHGRPYHTYFYIKQP